MADLTVLTVAIVAAALIFDFINGFHDAANATATIVATRVLKHWQAVCWSAFFNFSALFIVSTGVAKTVGSGLIDLEFVNQEVIFTALLAGIAWNLFTWWKGMPASSSHTLLGAYAGAAFSHVWLETDTAPVDVYIWDGWAKVLAFILIAPLVGCLIGFSIKKVTERFTRGDPAAEKSRFFKAAQLFSSAALSFNHGGNDAQKTAGIIAGALAAGSAVSPADFEIPFWVLFMAYLMISLGTLAGGWRVVKTLGFKLAKLRPSDGFSAETGAAISIAMATALHMPISTTLATTGSIVGVASAQNREKPVKWVVFKKILWTWGFTLPVAFLLGAFAMGFWHFVF